MRSSRGNGKAGRRGKVWRTVLMGLVLLAAGGLLMAVWQYVNKSWDGRARYTLVRTSPLAIESFDPVTGEGIRMMIPEDLEMETAAGRGIWRAGVMAELAEKFGWNWFKDSMTWYFEIPVTAVDHNWTVWDRWAWWENARKIQWKDVDLADTAWVRSKTTPDDVQVLGLTENWDSTARRWFGSANLARESLDLRIVNTTESAGMGGKAAKIVEHAGVRVVMITNNDAPVNNCRVERDKENANLVGVKLIVRVFGCEEGETEEGGEAGVRWILGEKFRDRWLGQE